MFYGFYSSVATCVKITKTDKHGTGKGWHDRVIQVANTKFVWAKIGL